MLIFEGESSVSIFDFFFSSYHYLSVRSSWWTRKKENQPQHPENYIDERVQYMERG